MKILVIDDSVAMRRIIRDYLEVLGFDAIVEAHDGESALAVMASQAVDLVITDWAMPSMSGPDLVRAIRSSPTHGRLPVLMVTGISEQEDIAQAIEAGVDGYIVKPFAPETLKEKMNELIAKLPPDGHGQRTVFIVEDSRTMRGLVRGALETEGYEVLESPDGRQALTVMQTLHPDLVITDINMPDMDGISLLREIRRNPVSRSTPVLILTTERDADIKATARLAGATGWIRKPFDPEQLRRVVADVFRKGQGR